MTERVVATDASSTVLEAAKLMSKEDVGSVLVVEEGKLVGILSNRAITQLVVAEGIEPETAVVRDFMRDDLIPAKQDDDLIRVAKYMQEIKVRRLPVVDDGEPVGVISVSDIAHFIKYYIDCILEEADERVERRKRS